MHWRRDDISDPAHTTCQWILEHESYQKWYKDPRGLLWIKGNPGAGKSTVLKYALETAKQNDEGLILASFFFHGRGSPIQKSPLGLFRSLLHQILQQVPGLLTKFASLYRQRCDTEGQNGQKWNWRERDLQKFFSSRVIETAKIFPMRLYIDALDECGQESAIDLVAYFYRLADSVAICFACRHYPIVSLEEDGIEISVEHENSTDIDAYITNRIQHAIRDEKVASSIRHELMDRSASNFQWVVLVTPRVVKFYKKGKSLKDICMLIRGLPSELATLYEEIVRGAEPDDVRQALHLFQWICFAFRPLTLQEIREATALDIHSSHTSLQESRTSGQYAETDEEMERRVLNLSQGLAEVEKHGAKRIVQFVHQSVTDFLLQQGFHLLFEQLPDDRLKGSVTARSHFWISRACIKYVSLDEVTSFRITPSNRFHSRNALKELCLTFVLVRYALENWIAHSQIVEQEKVVQDDLIALFQPTSSVLPALHKWNWHTKDLILHGMIQAFVSGMTLLHIASRFGLSSVVSCILKQGTRNAEIEARDEDGGTPLHHAAEGGHEAIVRYLLENRAQNDPSDKWSNTPMHLAAEGGHKGVVHLLLEAGAAVDPGDYEGITPLSLAAYGGHIDVVVLLLRWGATADTVDEYGETALFYAVHGRSERTVEFLLQIGAQVNTKGKVGRTPISSAVRGNYESILRLLLNWGANIDTVDDYGETPLFPAVRRGYQPIMELLLEKGAQVNTTSQDGATPISLAVANGQESIVRLLFEHGADPDSVIDEHISYAADKGFNEVLELIRCAKEGKPLPPPNQTPHNPTEVLIRRKGKDK